MQSMTGVAEDSIRFYCKLEDDNAVKDYLKGGGATDLQGSRVVIGTLFLFVRV